MESKEKILMILKRNNQREEQINEKGFKNKLMMMPCKKDSEKVVIELYLLELALEEVVEEVGEVQKTIDIDKKVKNRYEGVNMIVGLRRDIAMVKDGLARVKEKIERG